MALSETITIGYNLDGAPIQKNVALSGGSRTVLSETVADDAADVEMALAIDVSELELLIIDCDVGITIETNDGTTPDDTLTIAAGVPLIWYTGCGHANPLGTDVTAIFVTQTDATEGTLVIKALVDPTP